MKCRLQRQSGGRSTIAVREGARDAKEDFCSRGNHDDRDGA